MAYKKNRQTTFDGKFSAGDGCNRGFGGDAYPYRVIAVSDSGKEVMIARVHWEAQETALVRLNNLFGDGKPIETFISTCSPDGSEGIAVVTGQEDAGLVVKFSRKSGWAMGKGLRAARDPSF